MQDQNEQQGTAPESGAAAFCPVYVPMYDRNGGPSVCKALTLSRTKAKQLAQRSDFPKPVVFASNCLRYRLDEVTQWMDAQRGQMVGA